MRAVSERLPQPRRSDAQGNRERILEAARTVFATAGFTASMRTVAQEAGVSPATVYRHFPTKAILARESYLDQAQLCRSIVAEGSAEPDPWRGFCLVIERIFDLHSRDRGFPAAFASKYPDALNYSADARASLQAMARLVARAKAAGALRPDFAMNDLVLLMQAHRGVRAGSPAAHLAASKRFAALAIQAFQRFPDERVEPRVLSA